MSAARATGCQAEHLPKDAGHPHRGFSRLTAAETFRPGSVATGKVAPSPAVISPGRADRAPASFAAGTDSGLQPPREWQEVSSISRLSPPFPEAASRLPVHFPRLIHCRLNASFSDLYQHLSGKAHLHRCCSMFRYDKVPPGQKELQALSRSGGRRRTFPEERHGIREWYSISIMNSSLNFHNIL